MARLRLSISKRVSSPESDSTSSGSSTSLKSQPFISKKRKITEEEQEDGFSDSEEEEEEFLVPREEDLLVPPDLYCYIQEALVLRDHLKTNNNDMDSILDLESAEGAIVSYAEELKKFNDLPHDWKYDPAAAKSYKSSSYSQRLKIYKPPPEEEEDPMWGSCNRCCAPVKIRLECYAKTDGVPLSRAEKKIWKEFQEFDKNIPGLGALNLYRLEKAKRAIKIDNPIVSLVGNFAIASFNKAIEKSVKRGVHKNLHDFEFMECAYIKMFQAEYYFYLTIEAVEEGRVGVYETKVTLNWKDGRKSLCTFLLTDRTPRGKKIRVKHYQMTDPGHWLDPMLDKYTGMKPRSKSASYMGYDYRTPWGFEGP